MALKIALAKGRLGDKAYALLKLCGYGCLELETDSRKLIFFNTEKNIEFFLVKPSDVAIYVENGAADIGVVGKDILLEQDPDVYEMLDLGFGRCTLSTATLKNRVMDVKIPFTVATKYVNFTRKYYDNLGLKATIIELNGSVELGPLVGLSDMIVDIVETGSTLKENNLVVLENLVEISARLIVNKSSFKFKHHEIIELIKGLKNEVK